MFEIPKTLISTIPRLQASTLFLRDGTSYDHYTYYERKMLVYNDRRSKLPRLGR